MHILVPHRCAAGAKIFSRKIERHISLALTASKTFFNNLLSDICHAVCTNAIYFQLRASEMKACVL